MNNFKPTNQRTYIKKKKILERYNYQNWLKEIENLNKSVTVKDTEIHIKNLHTKKSLGTDGSTDEAYEIFKKWLVLWGHYYLIPNLDINIGKV